jgi:hypothetical protein
MKFIKVESKYKNRVTVNIFLPVTGKPTSNQHNSIRRKTAGNKVHDTTSTDVLTSCINGEVRLDLVQEPCMSGYRAIFI